MLAQPLAQNFMNLHPYQESVVNAQAKYGTGGWTQDLPIQRPYAKSVGSYSSGLTYAQHELLRQRKTPQGRLLEAQDIATIEQDLPASKHLLLSLSPNGEELEGMNYGRKRRYENDPYIREAGTARWTGHQSQAPSANFRYEPAWYFPGGYDSALAQNMPMNHDGRFYSSRSQVPTVLPALQTSFGPTASAGQQYYGPYWPDGTFSPYRPSPVRDDRFFHWRSSRDTTRDFNPSSTKRLPIPPPSHFHGSRNVPQVLPAMVQNVRGMQSLPPRDAYAPYASFQDRISSALEATNPLTGFDAGQARPELYPGGTNQLYLDGGRDSILFPTSASEKIAHRDRVFTSAYRVYIELLANVQQMTKLEMQQKGTQGQTKSSKPPIFPRPPRRSASNFAESTASRHGRNHSRHDQKLCGILDTASRPPTAIRLPRRASDFGVSHGQQHQYSFGAQSRSSSDQQLFTGVPIQTQYNSTIRQTDHFSSTHQYHVSAKASLSAVEALCYGSETVWTDGMLLAGCLAYGIEEYDRALGWYQKVLKHDPRNVEAVSNSAATLLALGRQEEAANNWQFAIKLRPSYFEAVEHLVGLYVSCQKTRQAIDTIEYIESCLKLSGNTSGVYNTDLHHEDDSDTQSRASSATISSTEGPHYDFDFDRRYSHSSAASEVAPGFGAFGYAIAAADNGRLIALIHAKGNMLYSLGNNKGAAAAFEDAILTATGDRRYGIKGLINRILHACISTVDPYTAATLKESKEPVLLAPDRAQQIAQRMFAPSGDLPGLAFVPLSTALRAAVLTTSNSLLSLAKIYQDGLCSQSPSRTGSSPGTREILALYYLSLSLQPSPSTANNVGILLASVQTTTTIQVVPQQINSRVLNYTGVVPGSGIALALAYYNYGLNLDGKHAHLYTNLGSLLKDLGELPAAIKMYETAVQCDKSFDIALANLANAVKDQGRVADAIKYYKRAVQANPDFAEAVCGLATALNSVCDWYSRGGVYADNGKRDKVHVDENGMMYEARKGSGWMNKVVEIVDKQLRDGELWGAGNLTPSATELLCQQLTAIKSDQPRDKQLLLYNMAQQSLSSWAGQRWEGSRVVRLVERAVKYIGWQWYQDRFKHGKEYPTRRYARPVLPLGVPIPSAPTVLPFHTFTTPLSARQVRQISQCNALRISVSTMKSSWLPRTVYPPPAPPSPCLRVGYVSSDFNNHPLAHLMQSIFGLHNPKHVRAYCYATTASDGSIHRQQIEQEAPVFHDASMWNMEKLVNQIVADEIHILVNLNGYTRGARNEVFAARPAPLQMSFMGFAGTLGAEWCDYVYADEISVPPNTLAPYRHNVDIEDKLNPKSYFEDLDNWIYAENIIFSRSSFFCVDHKQSAPDAKSGPPPLHDPIALQAAWSAEQSRRWTLRKDVFPYLPDNYIILGNFNQLYKIDPTTFKMYLRILSNIPNAILWLLRFPDIGETNLKHFAKEWAGAETASRLVFTDVAPKGAHITRASIVDLFLDTPECNAHTTAADVIWSGTPIVTWARWEYKMCSRMASSIVASALPEGQEGDQARKDLLVNSEREYEEHAVRLATGLRYLRGHKGMCQGYGEGRLMDLRRMLWEGRWSSRLFDTRRWVVDLERAYWAAWRNWEEGRGGDIWL